MGSKLLVPVLAVTFLAVSGFVVIFFMGSGSIETDYTPGQTVKLDFVLVKCVTPVSVENAGWQISVVVSNRGKGSFGMYKVYVNKEEVDMYGLVHGDVLPDGKKIGTSVPSPSLIVEPSETRTIYVWVGNELFSPGTQVVININDPNSITLMKAVTLT